MKHYQLTAANGMIVSIPEDRLSAWKSGQEQVLKGAYQSDIQLTKEILVQMQKRQKSTMNTKG